MTNLVVSLPDERMDQLKEVAARIGVSVADLVRVGVEELLSKPDEEFEKAVSHVLAKNAELYRRLA